jgi:ppGpp synthetase/RelA/SpoT-type nucleotidyltranferase
MEQYFEWARSVLGVDFENPKHQRVYEANLTSALTTIQESGFLDGLREQLKLCNKEYRELNQADLLMWGRDVEQEVTPLKKSYPSAVNKTFRKNVVFNQDFPEPPGAAGWLTPDNWYSNLNDLIRSTVVCKFIDGPAFLASRLVEYAQGLRLEARSYSQEREEGYYAYHFYAKFNVSLVDLAWNDQRHAIEFEIQLATQLQDVLKELTHTFYEASRIQAHSDQGKWKWDFRTNRFRASYLSHTLHLLEAIVVELRDQSIREREANHGA